MDAGDQKEPRDGWLRLWRRHWLIAPLVVGAVSFALQAIVYLLVGRIDPVNAALQQASWNVVVAVVGSIWLRLRYR